MAIRPPLMSRGQANDFYSYMGIGTGLMFLAGGVAAGPAALALGLCGLGAVSNNRRESGRCGWLPQMVYQPPNTKPPAPLSFPHWEQWAYDAVRDHEAELEREFGINAVYCYRYMVLEGHKINQGHADLCALLYALREQGYWGNGRIQSGNLTPKQLLDQITGRRVASLEMQRFFHPQYFAQFYEGARDNSIRKGESELVQQRHLIDFSLMIYILGLTPISNRPVHRIKWWADRLWSDDPSRGHPLYYVADWDWFVGDTVDQLRGRWDWVMEDMVRRNGMPRHFVDEADDLWHYRVEVHRGDGPPGHPGGVLMSNVLFGRTQSYPATEEDMLGKH